MTVSLAPMLPTAGALPTGPGWGFEFKWDGMRVLIAVNEGRVQVTSRSGVDYTAAFPELASLAAANGNAVFDGEIIAVDDEARPSFALAAKRFTCVQPTRDLIAAVPVTFLAFDLLRVHAADITAEPYRQRRAALEQLHPIGSYVQVPAWHDDGSSTLAAALDIGLEGIVAKKLSSLYTPGRSSEWIKIKSVSTTDVVIGGWRGTPKHVRSLLVGVPASGGLTYRGRVASGLSQDDIGALLKLLPVTNACPFDPLPPPQITGDAIWVSPLVVVEVSYAHLTSAGRMRHPRYIRARPDKTPADIHEPDPTA